jgi:hypothetical protein
MYRKDHTLFQTIVDVGGFEGGSISGPKQQCGIIVGVHVNSHKMIVIRWRHEDGTPAILPMVFPIRAVTRYHSLTDEDVEEEYFQVQLGEDLRYVWVLCRPQPQPTAQSTTPDSPAWGE